MRAVMCLDLSCLALLCLLVLQHHLSCDCVDEEFVELVAYLCIAFAVKICKSLCVCIGVTLVQLGHH